MDHHTAGRLSEAGNLYLQALALAPRHPGALHMLGVVLFTTGQFERSLEFMQRAQALQAENAELLTNMGSVLQQLGRLDDALASFDRALALTPDFAFGWSNRALVLFQMRRFEAALESFDRAIALKPEAADMRWHAAVVRLQLGDFARGWPDYEWRWRTALKPAAGTDGPRWTGAEPILGRTLLLHAEQGLGDTLQFCRYASLAAARGARVILAVQASLVRLLDSLPGVAKVVDLAGPLPAFDLQCPLMSLPLAFGTRLDTIPAKSSYLSADPARVAAWRTRLRTLPGLRIGLVWSGAPRREQVHLHSVDRRRSMRLAELAPLAAVPGLSFVSLQKGEAEIEARTPPAGMVLHDWADELRDFADTAALAAALDLVICVDTAVAHLAGAVGSRVWVLNRHDTCWRWLHEREDTPWYPNMRLFTQSRPGDWPEVVRRVANALSTLAA